MSLNPSGWFDTGLRPPGWFDKYADIRGWFDVYLITSQDSALGGWDTSQGVAGQANRRLYNQLRRDDELVTDLLVTLVTQGFFDGHAQGLFGSR